MRDLLIRLDTKVDNITATLGLMNQRADHHDDRIKALEVELADRKALKHRFYELEHSVGTMEKSFHAGRVMVVGTWAIIGPAVTGLVAHAFGVI